MNTKSVFVLGKEYFATNFYDDVFGSNGVKIQRNDTHLGSIVGVTIPDDIDDIEANVAFDKEVEDWVADNMEHIESELK